MSTATWVTVLAITLGSGWTYAQDRRPAEARSAKAPNRLPVSFLENKGQASADILWQARGDGFQAEFGRDSFLIEVGRGGKQRILLAGADPQAQIEPLDPLPGKVSFFLDSNPAHWAHGLATYSRLRYKSVYPGVDLVFYGNHGALEYDFTISPGADPGAIRLKIEDDPGAHVTETGELETTAGGEKLWHRPMLYQDIDTGKRAIAGRFAKLADGEFGFAAGEYDRTRPLIVDPAVTLVYATYFGGVHTDVNGSTGYSVAVDAQGNTYVAGSAVDITFPVSGNAVQPYFESPNCSLLCGFSNGVLAKFSPSGVLLYSTYLGSDTYLNGVAVDRAGNAYVLAYVANYGYWSVYPTTPGAYPSTPGGQTVIGISEISPDGSQLLFSILFGGGGSGFLIGNSIALDQNGAIYIGGEAGVNPGIPTTAGAYQTTAKGDDNGFIAKFDPAQTGLAQLVYGTYLGGSQTGAALSGRGVDSIAVDSLGQVYAVGTTNSSDYPLTANAQVPNNHWKGCLNAVYPSGFLTILNASGSGLVYSSYVGGHTSVTGYCGQGVGSVALGPGGNIYMFGSTDTIDLPVKNAYQSTSSYGDGFVAKWSPDGSQNLFTTYIDLQPGSNMSVDSQGNAWVMGSAFNGGSANISTANGLYQGIDGQTLVAEISASGSQLLFATSIAPPNTGSTYSYSYTVRITGTAIAIDSQGNLHIVGNIDTNNMPVTPNAFMSQLLEPQNIFLEIIGTGGIDTISPVSGGNSGDVTVTVGGSGFQQGAACALTSGGTTLQAANVTVSTDGSTVTCTFALNGASPGSYAVTLTNPGGSPFSIPGGFTVQNGSGPQIVSNIVGRPIIRNGVPSTFTVTVTNTGDTNAYFTVVSYAVPSNFTIAYATPQLDPFYSADPLNYAALTTGQPWGNGYTYYADLIPTLAPGQSISIPLSVTVPDTESTFSLGVSPQFPWYDSMADMQVSMNNALANASALSNSCAPAASAVMTQDCIAQFVSMVVEETADQIQADTNASNPPNLAGRLSSAAITNLEYLVGLAASPASTASTGALGLSPKQEHGGGSVHMPEIPSDVLNGALKYFAQNAGDIDDLNYYACNPILEIIEPIKVCQSICNTDYYQNKITYICGNPHSSTGPQYSVTYNGLCTALAWARGVGFKNGKCSIPLSSGPGGGRSVPSLVPNFSSLGPRTSACNNNNNNQQEGPSCSNSSSANATDPNYKTGPTGDASTSQYVAPTSALTYNVGFENEPSASLSAAQVIVTDQLNPTLVDLTTLALGNISFGSTILTPPSGVKSYSTTYSINSSMSVRIQGSLNPDNGLLTWTFTTIDPSTGLPPTDPTVGFLPPDADGVQGQGSVLFTVMPKAGLATGTQIANQATVVFDANSPIGTQTWMNTIDASLPVSAVAALPPTESSPTFPVSWSGTDVGSGIATYAIFVSDNGGAYTPWQPAATATSAAYIGQFGHTYAFYSIATDGAGNIQAAKNSPDTTTAIPVPAVGACDVGNYGTVTLADLQQLIDEALGAMQPTNDLNVDGTVNVVDVQIAMNAALNLGCYGQ